jgi:hypothetical protein
MEEQLAERVCDSKQKIEAGHVAGFVFEHIYRLDQGGGEYILVVAFADKAAYMAHANEPTQHDFYLAFRGLMEDDPVWHDGEIIYSV